MDVIHGLLKREPSLCMGLAGDYADGARAFLERFRDPRVDVFAAHDAPRARVGVLDTMHRPGDPSFVDKAAAETVREKAGVFVMVSSSLDIELPVVPDLFIDHLPDVHIRGEQPRERHVGFQFAPVAEEFFEQAREPAPERPGALVAVIGGGTRQTGPATLARVVAPHSRKKFDGFCIVVSPHFPEADKAELREMAPDIEILQGVPSLAPLLTSAAAVLCTYGNITYEALSCGRPTFLAGYEGFQDEYGDYLQRKGLVVNFGRFDELEHADLSPLFDAELRARLARNAVDIFREPGITNIVRLLLAHLKN
jgi:hypothetical protein